MAEKAPARTESILRDWMQFEKELGSTLIAWTRRLTLT